MALNVDVLNFGLGQEPQASWRHNCASYEEAFGLFAQAASGTSYNMLVLLIEGKTHGYAVRVGDNIEISVSHEEMS